MEKPKVQKNGEGLSRCSGEGFQILGLDRCHQNVLQCNSLYFVLSYTSSKTAVLEQRAWRGYWTYSKATELGKQSLHKKNEVKLGAFS